jgi:hypothetical protein
MLHRSLPLVAVVLLLAACATTSTSPTPPASRTDGAIDVFEMHPDPLVETRTEFWDGRVRSGYLQGPPQGAYGRVSTWLERSAPSTWKGLVESPSPQAVESLSVWKGAPIGPTLEGSAYMRLDADLHVDASRITGATTDLATIRTTTGFRIQGTWMGASWDVEVTPERITRKGNGKTRIWTRVEPGLYQLEGRPQVRARWHGAAVDPATSPLPETAFAVLLAQL